MRDALVWLAGFVVLSGGCGDEERVTEISDIVPPNAVADLAASATTDSSTTLAWTAPGDDGLTGRASAYDIRYSTDTLAESTWASATRVTLPPVPGSVGSPETITIAGLASGTLYHFALKATDEVPNWSALSNVVVGTTPQRLCQPTAPESVLCDIEVLYNDKVRPTQLRVFEYDALLSQQFIFRFQAADIENGLPESWGHREELEAHEGLFAAHNAGNIYSLTLSIAHDPARDLDPPEPGREGWKMIFASNVYIRLLFTPNDGLEVNGGQARFEFPPPVDGRWAIGDWRDLPRPFGPGGEAVEAATWGALKAIYRR